MELDAQIHNAQTRSVQPNFFPKFKQYLKKRQQTRKQCFIVYTTYLSYDDFLKTWQGVVVFVFSHNDQP